MANTKTYLERLKKRAGTSRVYQRHQLDGLEIADLLGDRPHKALYIRLAKEHDSGMLRAIAEGVAEKTSIRNKGAYFMAILAREGRLSRPKKTVLSKKKPKKS